MVTPSETHTGELAELAEAISVALTIIFKSLWDLLEQCGTANMAQVFKSWGRVRGARVQGMWLWCLEQIIKQISPKHLKDNKVIENQQSWSYQEESHQANLISVFD